MMARDPAELSRIYLRPTADGQDLGEARAGKSPQHPSPRATATKVEIGQIYRKADVFPSFWEVIASFADGSGVRHARMRSMRDPTAVKLIAEAALRNPKFYAPVDAARPGL